MFKKILTDLYERVFVAKKSTLVGLLLVAGDVVAQNLLASNNQIIHAVALVLGAVLTFYKGTHPPEPTPA